MKPPTADELLSFMLSTIELLSHPASYLVIQTLQDWDREAQWRPRIRTLRKRDWIQPASASARFPYLITPAGRKKALGPLNPETWWNRSWNGQWMAFSFDLSVNKPACRRYLLRWLHAQRFGLLQNSLWIRPDLPIPPFPPTQDLPNNVDGLIILQARCHGGFTDAQIVNAAWDFDSINDRYRLYLDLCEQRHEQLLHDPDPPHTIAWFRQERSAWDNATRIDPLLPRCLWPTGYLGPAAWHTRRQLLGL